MRPFTFGQPSWVGETAESLSTQDAPVVAIPDNVDASEDIAMDALGMDTTDWIGLQDAMILFIHDQGSHWCARTVEESTNARTSDIFKYYLVSMFVLKGPCERLRWEKIPDEAQEYATDALWEVVQDRMRELAESRMLRCCVINLIDARDYTRKVQVSFASLFDRTNDMWAAMVDNPELYNIYPSMVSFEALKAKVALEFDDTPGVVDSISWLNHHAELDRIQDEFELDSALRTWLYLKTKASKHFDIVVGDHAEKDVGEEVGFSGTRDGTDIAAK